MSVTGQTYNFRGSAPGGGGGASFAPERTLFVAQSWPLGVDPLVYFVGVGAALVQALTLTPTKDNPVMIEMFPGLYDEPVDLVGNVHLCCAAPHSVIIAGFYQWQPTSADDELLSFEGIDFNDSASILVDTRGKTGGVTSVDVRDGNVNCNAVYTGRTGGADQVNYWDGKHAGLFTTYDGVRAFANASSFGGILNFNTDTVARFGDVICDDAVNCNGTSNVEIRGSRVNSTVNVAAGAFISMPGTASYNAIAVAGGADLRMCEYGSAGNLSGAGEVQRSIWQTTIGPTAIGANAVPIAPMMASVSYRVVLAQTAGTPTPVLVTAKAQASFTLTDAVGGNTFDVAIIAE